jgi:arginyl-tRNA synthetase
MSSNIDPRTQIIKSLQKVTNQTDIHLEVPEREEFGNYSTNIAMQVFTKLKTQKSKLKTTAQKIKDNNQFNHLTIQQFNNPREVAEEMVKLLTKDKKLMEVVDRIQIAGPGFINFWLTSDVLLNNMIQIDSNSEEYGKSELLKGKKILIEHTSPNPQTTIMLGHLRNNFLGMTMSNIFEYLGAKVVKDCIVNDRGIHICRSIWGYLAFTNKNNGLSKEELINFRDVTDEKLGEICSKADWREQLSGWIKNPSDWFVPDDLGLKPDHANLIWYVLGSKAYKLSEVVHNQVEEILQAWEREEKEVWSIWKQILDWSAKGYEETYKRIGSVHNWVWHESDLYKGGKELVEKGLISGVFVKSKGAIVTNLEKYKLPDTVAIKSDGTSTYLVFDLNLTLEKQRKFPSDLYIWTIGQEQTLYFQQLFSVCEQLGLGDKKNFFHLSYALINFKGGGKMATREGSVVMADEILKELETKVNLIVKDESRKELRKGMNVKEVIQEIALGAIKYSLLRYSRETTAFYDPDLSISLEGNSGPYLQYTYARTQSVLEKSGRVGEGMRKSKFLQDLTEPDGSLSRRPLKSSNSSNNLTIQQFNNEELSVMRELLHYTEVVQAASENYAPNLICNYLYDLAQKFNTFYNSHKILVDDPLKLELRLKLTASTGAILKSGLNLLGIHAPERM